LSSTKLFSDLYLAKLDTLDTLKNCSFRVGLHIVRISLKSIELHPHSLIGFRQFSFIFPTKNVADIGRACTGRMRARQSRPILRAEYLYLSSHRNNGVAGLGTVVAN